MPKGCSTVVTEGILTPFTTRTRSFSRGKRFLPLKCLFTIFLFFGRSAVLQDLQRSLQWFSGEYISPQAKHGLCGKLLTVFSGAQKSFVIIIMLSVSSLLISKLS